MSNLKPIFSTNADINKAAYMNWRTTRPEYPGVAAIPYNMKVIADGFRSAALRLLNVMLSDNKDKIADVLIFPVLYSVNQAIELYLKAIIYHTQELLSLPPKVDKTHDIQKLFAEATTNLHTYYMNNLGYNKTQLATLDEMLNGVDAYITELYSYIAQNGKPQMDFARYPFDSKDSPYFYVAAMDNVVIDLENALVRFTNIMDNLKSLFYDVADKSDWVTHRND